MDRFLSSQSWWSTDWINAVLLGQQHVTCNDRALRWSQSCTLIKFSEQFSLSLFSQDSSEYSIIMSGLQYKKFRTSFSEFVVLLIKQASYSIIYDLTHLFEHFVTLEHWRVWTNSEDFFQSRSNVCLFIFESDVSIGGYCINDQHPERSMPTTVRSWATEIHCQTCCRSIRHCNSQAKRGDIEGQWAWSEWRIDLISSSKATKMKSRVSWVLSSKEFLFITIGKTHSLERDRSDIFVPLVILSRIFDVYVWVNWENGWKVIPWPSWTISIWNILVGHYTIK